MHVKNDDFLKEIQELYKRGLSLMEISKQLHCSVHKVTYWMQKGKIARRNLSDAMYAKYNPDGDPFKIKTISTVADARLFGLGCGIYWGEGDKRSRHATRVGNTNPEILLTFIRFLTDICGVSKTKISYSIVCFNDSDPQVVGAYWAKVFDVSLEKFGKIVQIPQQGKGTYKRKSRFGVCTVSVSNIKLKKWILETLDSFGSLDMEQRNALYLQDSPDSLMAK